jgi:HAD superfamily hydrolase (TIGR01509 family)
MKAAIFDMDGVIIDSEPLHYLSDKTLLKRLGIEVPDTYLDKYVGVTNPVMWKELIKDFSIPKDLQEILNTQKSLKLKLLKSGDYKAIEGIPDLLKDLYKHGIPIAIASSSSSIFIKEVIKILKIGRYIDIYVSGENIEKSKPDPDIFLKTAELLQLKPSGCVVIEDSTNGVIAAKRAGMKCIGFQNTNSGKQDLSKADIVVSSISEITIDRMNTI